jgi:hypothetical protein
MVLNVTTYCEAEVVFWLRIWERYNVAVVVGPEAQAIDRSIAFGYGCW